MGKLVDELVSKIDHTHWSYMYYRKLQWARDNGCKLYYGAFEHPVPETLLGVVRHYVTFWAHHPTEAMRTICKSGKDPLDFDGQEIN